MPKRLSQSIVATFLVAISVSTVGFSMALHWKKIKTYTTTSSHKLNPALPKKVSTRSSVKKTSFVVDSLIENTSGSNVICSGSSITLRAKPAPAGATYQWVKDGTNITAATSSTCITTVAGTYTVKVTNNGKTITYPDIVLTASVTPVASFTNTATDLCTSSPVRFTSTSTGNNITYRWNFDDPNSGSNNTSTLANPVHKFIGSPGTGNQTYSVSLTVTNSDGCNNSVTKPVKMRQRPGTELAGDARDYNGVPYFVGCNNAPTLLQFANQSATRGSNTSYSINWGDGSPDFTSTTFSSTTGHTYAVGTYRLRYIVANNSGCIDTAFYNVFIGGNPAVGLANPGNTSICTGSSLTFPVTGTQNNPAGTVYTVKFNDGSPDRIYTTAPDTIKHFFNKSSCGAVGGNYPNAFSVTIVASNPCSSSSAEVAPIYVSDKPDPKFTVSQDVNCVNNTVTFSTQNLGRDVNNGVCKASNFVWSISPATGWVTNSNLGDDAGGSTNPNLWQSGSANLPVRFTTPGTYTIKLLVGSGNCGNGFITKTVCINPAPTASFTTDVAAGCGPLTVKATNTSPAPNCGNNTYQWAVSPNTGFVFANGTSATSANPQFTFNNAGTYTLSLTTSNSNGQCFSSPATKTITVTTKPTVSPIVAPPSVCEGNTVSPTAAVTSSGTPTYLWTFEGGSPATSTLATPGVITYAAPGNYTTTLAVTNNCGTTTVTKAITVATKPTVVQPGNYQFCAGDPSGSINFTGSVGANFNWTNDNVNIGLGAAGTGNISFNTKNLTNAPIVANIKVTPVSGCTGTPASFKITINPRPTTATTSPDAKTCLTSFQLDGNVASVGTGAWTQTSGPTAAISNTADPKATVSNLTKGTRYSWTWTISTAGCASSSKVFTLDVLSDIINTIKTNTTAVCPGQIVNLTTNVLTGGDIPATLPASYSYVWESSLNGVSNWTTVANSNTASLTVTPVSSIWYRRKVQSFNQCEVTSNIINITLNASVPAANAGAPINICNQTQVQLSGNDPGGSFVGTWTDDNPNSTLVFSPDAHAYNATVSGLAPGRTYSLTWTINSVSCGATNSKVTITNLPPLTNVIGPATTTICFGQSTTISGLSNTGGTGSYSYKWESSTDKNTWAVIPAQTGANLIISPTQNTYYKRTVTSGACSLVSNEVEVKVLPAIANNTISAPQQLCIGAPVALLNGNLPTGGDGTNYSYQWQQSFDDANWTNISGATAQNYQPGNLTQTMYYRRIVSSGLCSGGQQNISGSVKITVNPNAKAEFTASSTLGCIPFNLSTVITSVPHDDVNSTYTWLANGLVIGNGSAFPGYTITNDGAQVVIKLVTVSKFGCDTNSMSKTFNTTRAVKAAFTKDVGSGCGPLITRFTNTSAPIGGATYRWDFGNGSSSTLAQPGPITFQPNPFGRDTVYYIKLTAFTACATTIHIDSVLVNSKPRAVFTPDKTTGCSPFTIRITNQSTGLPNNYTFSFGNGDKITRTNNGAFEYTYTTNKTDTLTLTLVAENECGKDSSSYNIVVYPNSVQANLVVNGDNKSGCAPFGVKFDNNSVGANNFYYDFGDGTTATTTLSPESIFHTFTKPGIYVVKMTASNGCSTQSTTQTITVLAPPQNSFTTAQAEQCAKQPMRFTNTTVNLQNFTYTWDFGDGTSSFAVSPEHSYVTAGTFTVSLTAIQTAPDGTKCANTVTRVITILPPPLAAYSSNAAALNCAPFAYSVNSTPANATGVSWNFGDAGSVDNTAAGYTAKHYYPKAGVYQVQMIAYNQNGCADTTVQVVRVTETPKPQFATADTVLCGNSALISFKNNTTYGGADLVTYKWFINNVQVSSQKDLNYTFNVPSGAVRPYTFNVRLLATSTIGCSDTVMHTMRFNPLPVAKFSVPSAISCAPFDLNINNTSQYADQFQWFLDGVLVSTDRVPSHIILPQPSRTYKLKLIATNIYGCTPDEITLTLSTHPKPTASFSLVDSVSCNGRLDIRVTNKTAGATSYTWNFGDGTPEQTSFTPSHTYGVPGVYNLRLIAFNGVCRDTTVHLIQIASTPKASFVASTLQGCTSLSTTFQNTSTNSSNFLWDFGDGTFSTSKNPTHVYTYNNSPFTVKLIAYGEYGCTDEAVIVNYIVVTAPPVVDFIAQPDSVIQIPNRSFTFKNRSTGAGLTYFWDFGDGKTSTQQDPVHNYADAGTYRVKLTATNADGCSTTRVRTVVVENVQQYLYVPNAFEPGSALSELQTFNVRALGLKTYSIAIFNKWGQLVYQSTELDNKGTPLYGWNGIMMGQPAPLGVYVWKINAWFLDGTEWKGMKYKSGDTPSRTGILHLIR